MNESRRCSSCSCSIGVAAPLSTSNPRYTWIESQLTATGSSPRSRSRSASSIATAVLPIAVGPKIAITRMSGSFDWKQLGSGGATEQPLGAGERGRGGGVDRHLDQFARGSGAVEVDRLVVTGTPAEA